MRTLIIYVIAFSFLTGVYAQSSPAENNPVSLRGVTIKPLNLTYIRAVQDERFPDFVMDLEGKVARYDVRTSEVYDGNFEAYEVMFSHDNGSIIATYDQEGMILETNERFHNITFPADIRNKIYNDYPGWTIHKDAYLVTYFHDKGVKKVCKIQLRKEGKKKTLDIEI
jgi:hypothetical protein